MLRHIMSLYGRKLSPVGQFFKKLHENFNFDGVCMKKKNPLKNIENKQRHLHVFIKIEEPLTKLASTATKKYFP